MARAKSSPSNKKQAQEPTAWIHSTRLHLIMYSALLVATPFVMLQAFLQQAISRISRFSFTVAGLDIPIVPAVVLVLVVVLILIYRAQITRRRIAAGVVALLLVAASQQVADYYAAHRFYDLQHNWHYIAYGLFTFMVYRDLEPRGIPLHRIMLFTFCAAILYSSFDEAFQRHMSNRVFDISDIAKDSWGSVIGMVLVLAGGRHSPELFADWKRLRHKRLRDYLRHPMTLLVLMAVLSFLLVAVGSLLSDYEHLATTILITLAIFAVLVIVLHCSQYRFCKYALLAVLVVGVLAQGYFYLKYRNDNITYNRFGLTIYKGIPLPFFDVMFFPDGSFRLVDKKHNFKQFDRQFFLQQPMDVLIIGSGAQGRGGNGFPRKVISQFIYSPFSQRGVQVIIQETPAACKIFNRLKKERKNVLFVLHNSC